MLPSISSGSSSAISTARTAASSTASSIGTNRSRRAAADFALPVSRVALPGSEEAGLWNEAANSAAILICQGDKQGGMGGPCGDGRRQPGLFELLPHEQCFKDLKVSVLVVPPVGSTSRQSREIAITQFCGAVDWARRQPGGHSIALLGWGTSGAAALCAAVKKRRHLSGVCTLSAPVIGCPTELQLGKLGPMEILIGHGAQDDQSAPSGARAIFQKLSHTKRAGFEQIKMYGMAGHLLLEQVEDVVQDVCSWMTTMLDIEEL